MPSLWDRSARQRARLKSLFAPPPPTVTPPSVAPMEGLFGGDIRADDDLGVNQAQATSLGDFGQRVFEGLGMAGLGGLARGLIGRDMDVRSAQEAVGSMNMAGGALNPELQGRGYGQDYGGGVDLGAMGGQTEGGFSGSGIEGDRGFLAKGGKVNRPLSLFEGVDPPGPDDVIIAAKKGERVLNEAQYASLSKEAKAEVDRVLNKAKRA